ncbi:MAG: DNA topoisomerase IB [Proteobacteria bacterium]|nr:DNA topoisomerase IB [Pseudomonadota bacterium]
MSTGPGSLPELRDAVPRGLIYVSDRAPGISRRRNGKGYVYRLPDGGRLADDHELQRIRSLAIPPAYTQVWICTEARGHLQATGRDARGRKQYRYHPDWRTARDATKYDRLLDFAAALPRIRAQVERDLAAPIGPGLGRALVLATIVRLLDTTMLRIGNDEYARQNGSYGLTTLQPRHVRVDGTRLQLRFRGKSGVLREVAVDDARVARIVARCQALPGQELFGYLADDGQVQTVGSADVNDYLRHASGGDYTAKDFRTWHGSVHALELLRAGVGAEAPGRSRAKAVLEGVALRLGNTVAVCRKAYVHPQVLELLTGDGLPADAPPPARRAGLSLAERRFVAFLGIGRKLHKQPARGATS